MPKKKRTRKQKIQTDQRHIHPSVMASNEPSQRGDSPSKQQKHENTTTSGVSFSLPASYANKHVSQKATPSSQPTTIAIATNEYDYLGKDLKKTLLLTIIIAIAEFLIRFFYPIS